MKLLLKLTLLLLLLPMTTQAQDRSAITKMDTMAFKLYLREDYKKCAEVLQKQKDLVAKILTEKDTAYFANLRFQARCYFRLNDYEKAQKVAKEALDNWEQNHGLNNRNYILMLDNYATYLGCGDKPDYEAALKYAKDALERYEKLQKNDVDMAFILIHVAENSYDNKKYEDALKYEIRALHIYKEIYGEHSDEYIGEEEAALFTEKELPYGVAYMAGCSEYALATDSAEFSKEMFRHAMTRMIIFYHGGNNDLTGKVPYLEKFTKEYDKNGIDAVMALIDKYYEKLMKQVNDPKIKRLKIGN